MSSASLCRRVDCDASHCPQIGRVAGTSFADSVPSEDLIEDDGAECCGAYSAHFEIAERESKVAGAGGERHSAAIMFLGLQKSTLFSTQIRPAMVAINPNSTIDNPLMTGPRIDRISAPNFGEKPNRIETVAAKTKRRVE